MNGSIVMAGSSERHSTLPRRSPKNTEIERRTRPDIPDMHDELAVSDEISETKGNDRIHRIESLTPSNFGNLSISEKRVNETYKRCCRRCDTHVLIKPSTDAWDGNHANKEKDADQTGCYQSRHGPHIMDT